MFRRSGRRGVVDDLATLNGGPFESLDPDTEGGQSGQDDHRLEPHLLSLIELRLRRPIQKRHDILRHLAGGGRCSIRIVHYSII